MLNTTLVELLTQDLVSISRGGIINRVSGGTNKVYRAKFKNIVIFNFLAMVKLLVKSSFKSGFLTFEARLTFAKLKQAFIKAQILYLLNPECHIYVKANALGYAIDRNINQLTLDNLGQWHPVAFFFKKMISVKT